MSISSINTPYYAYNLHASPRKPEADLFTTDPAPKDKTLSNSDRVNNAASIVAPLLSENTPSIPPTALFGDLTGNGFVDVEDLTTLLASWGDEGGLADINRDGAVNQSDLDILLAYWGSDVSKLVKKEYSNKDFGDLNSDGTVDVQDLGLVLANYGTKNARMDINGDGVVDQTDLNLVLGYWGQNIDTLVATVNKENGVSVASPVPVPDDGPSPEDSLSAKPPEADYTKPRTYHGAEAYQHPKDTVSTLLDSIA